MGRFLLYITYLGTKYSGLQIQNVGHVQRLGCKTVVGVLQTYLSRLKPRDEVKIITSSRTDQGVHAFINTVHVDLLHRFGEEFEADFITHSVNFHLSKAKEDIRILKTIQVNDNFHSRYDSIGRSYMYRLAISKSSQKVNNRFILCPLLEQNRLHLVGQPFDFIKFQKAVEVLAGINNFSAMTVIQDRREKKCLVRNMTIGLKRGESQHSDEHKMVEDFDIWEIHLKAKSYLYKQIRRMVGSMVAVGKGFLDIADLKQLLKDPRHLDVIGHHKIISVPACGLYLKDVHYNPTDLVYWPNRDVDYQLFEDEAYENYHSHTNSMSYSTSECEPNNVEENNVDNYQLGIDNMNHSDSFVGGNSDEGQPLGTNMCDTNKDFNELSINNHSGVQDPSEMSEGKISITDVR